MGKYEALAEAVNKSKGLLEMILQELIEASAHLEAVVKYVKLTETSIAPVELKQLEEQLAKLEQIKEDLTQILSTVAFLDLVLYTYAKVEENEHN